MTVMEFEGKTEREAVARAASELGSESFDVEVLEKAGGLFGRGRVKIRVRQLAVIPDPMKPAQQEKAERRKPPPQARSKSQPRSGSETPDAPAEGGGGSGIFVPLRDYRADGYSRHGGL